jgi:dTDP-4-amino-4,6-dideoxygalactose transaminase
MGHAGAFSFNYYKNLTCGEGGAVVTNDAAVMQRARCMIDCCGFFWTGKEGDVAPFAASGARASELEGAMLDAQLDQVDLIIPPLRRQKRRMLAALAGCGLEPAKANSLEWECGTHTVMLAPTVAVAEAVAGRTGATIAANTGRHTYTEWDPVLQKRGAHHPALDPFLLPQNRECRMEYAKDMCPKSLDILGRALMWANRPERTDAETDALAGRIRIAVVDALAAEAVPQ